MATGTGASEAVAALAGRWRLLEWQRLDDTGMVLGLPLGGQPSGSLIYTPGGWMSGQLTAAERPQMSTVDPVGGSAEERAVAYSSYVAYSGPYEVDSDRVVHQVAMSLFPGWVGTQLIRYYTLTGNELVLRTPPMEVAGVVQVGQLRWAREESW